MNMFIKKKDGTLEKFNAKKIVIAIGKSADRINKKFTKEEEDAIVAHVYELMSQSGHNTIPVVQVHNFVENALEMYAPDVCKSYREYRNYKLDFVHILDDVYRASQSIMYIGDKENANADSALVSTKRSLILNELNKALYKKFFMKQEELQAIRDGYIYIHDMSARRDTMNCCLFNVGAVLKNGFEMGNVWYNEPNSLDTAFDVIGDIVLSAAAQQYGGFTIPQIDKILAPYAKKTYKKYFTEYVNIVSDIGGKISNKKADEYALEKTRREFEQGYQGLEYKFNTVGSSRGDYPFIATTFGLGTGIFEKMCSKTILKVHAEGQGRKSAKRPVLFPKLIFLYDENLHSEGKENYDVFLEAINCSSKTMYPDYLSLTGEGYVPEMYKKYGTPISPMGKCKLAHVKPIEPCLKGV